MNSPKGRESSAESKVHYNKTAKKNGQDTLKTVCVQVQLLFVCFSVFFWFVFELLYLQNLLVQFQALALNEVAGR